MQKHYARGTLSQPMESKLWTARTMSFVPYLKRSGGLFLSLEYGDLWQVCIHRVLQAGDYYRLDMRILRRTDIMLELQCGHRIHHSLRVSFYGSRSPPVSNIRECLFFSPHDSHKIIKHRSRAKLKLTSEKLENSSCRVLSKSYSRVSSLFQYFKFKIVCELILTFAY